jgi:hypothetical protein
MRVCKIIGWDSNCKLEYEEQFEGGRRIVYKERVVGIGGFPFLLSLLVLLYSKASYDAETASTLVLSQSLERNFEWCVLFSDITLLLPISPTPDPTCYTWPSLITSYHILNVPASLVRVEVLFWTLFCFLLGLHSIEPPLDTHVRRLHWPVTLTYPIWYPLVPTSITVFECRSMTVIALHKRIGLILQESLALCSNPNYWMLSRVSRLYLHQPW